MFALSPGIDRTVLDHAAQIGLPFAPGIMTPSDLQIALRANCKLVKFFPAMAAGGLSMLKNIAGPYLHTGIGFNPTGGVTRIICPTGWLTRLFAQSAAHGSRPAPTLRQKTGARFAAMPPRRRRWFASCAAVERLQAVSGTIAFGSRAPGCRITSAEKSCPDFTDTSGALPISRAARYPALNPSPAPVVSRMP